MRGYMRITDQIKDDIKSLYQEGLSYSEIEKQTGVSQAAISGIAKTLPPRKKWRSNDGREFIKRDSRFIGYDGESETTSKRATYVLLANSDGDSIYDRGGLSSRTCLEFLSQSKSRDSVRCWFRGHYDINHIVNDFPKDKREALWRNEDVFYEDWVVRYFPHKIFTIKSLFAKTGVTYYDTWGFFQSSFEQALEDVLHIKDPLISAGKAERANFDFSNADFIKAYNLRECELLSKMMAVVEKSVTIDQEGIKIKPRAWHGSGAVASAYLNNNPAVQPARKIEQAMSKHDLQPFYQSYGGGRIELLKVGRMEGVHAYDINSAYPASMVKLADLSHLHFVDTTDINNDALVGVLHLEWDFRDLFLSYPKLSRYAGPFMWRNKTGYISYPAIGRNWVWTHEYREMLNTPFAKYIKVLDKRLFEYRQSDFGKDMPVMYEMRRKLKDEGDGTQMGLKLAYNASYGKLAQMHGKGRYRVVIWASEITSIARASLLRAYLTNPDACFAFATDSIYSTEALDLPISKKLGDWEHTYHPSTTLLLPGLGELETTDPKKPKKLKVRGMPTFNMESVLDQIQNGRWVIDKEQDYEDGPQHATWTDDGSATVSSRIFVTHSLADHQPKAYASKRGRILTDVDPDCPTKSISPFNNLKRHYDFVDVSKPWKKFRLDRDHWGSRMATDLRNESNGCIVDSYPMSALKLDIDKDLADAEASADE